MAKTILVVDDEQAIVKTIESLLKVKGYEVITAFDGMEALTLARRVKPDLIILDVMLPKLDGYKICRMLKFDENYKHIRILMCTGRSDEEEKSIGYETGTDDYVTKPIEPAVLLKKIDELLSRKEEK